LNARNATWHVERLQHLWNETDAEPEIEPEGEGEGIGAGDEFAEMPALVPGPREGQREAVQGRALLEKAERLLEKVPAEDRAEVERLMERVRTALTDRQWDKLTTASNELADILFYLEDA